MGRYVLELHEIDGADVAAAGGKGANLGALTRVAGVRVPPGYCVTTDAYRRMAAAAPGLDALLDRLARVALDDREAIRALSAEVRRTIEAVAVPDEVAAEIVAPLAAFGAGAACAVRSSATAEDLPTASFAGQHDSYLHVVGPDAVLAHVRRCWGSLFTERAVTYRMRHAIDHRHVHMAVVVQRMVEAEAAGVLFTADPVTGNRTVAVIEAVVGLGEALVSGQVTPSVFRVRDGAVVERSAGADGLALTDAQAVRLTALGRRLEAHVGRPQDVEWCLVGDDVHVVQSRPITTLFPIPDAPDAAPRVYLSVGHQQMMTDAMAPLGISLWQLTTPRPMAVAGGRLFVDVTQALAAPASRAGLLDMLGRSDPLILDALQTVLDRGFVASSPDAPPAPPMPSSGPVPIDADPAIVAELIAGTEASLATLRQEIRPLTGAALLDFVLADVAELRRVLHDPRSRQVIMAGMEAAWWLNARMEEWLGERNVADTLSQSLPDNVTSAMGLALLDVADAIRPHPEVVALLARGVGDDVLDRLPAVAGGAAARDAIVRWLDAYGVRGVGEIDVTRPRWRERPSMLVPLLLGHVRHLAPGAAARRFAAGQEAARAKEAELLARLRGLPDGEARAEETQRMIDRVRTFAGFREYPKFGMIARYFVYKQALLAEADRLVAAGVLGDREDVFHLMLHELRDVVRTRQVDPALVARRRAEHRANAALTPPRVLTSEGEGIAGRYRRDDVPADALVGLAVSGGTVEGRARVVRDVAAAALAPGDILVTAYTDPSWTPLFVGIAGLVTEVGGQMTHGSVIAREYGLPAVVGVAHATTRIRDGERIRVHGTDGYVERLG